MSIETNLTGRWVGRYVQRGHSRPIMADLVQADEQLTGSMSDSVTDTEYSVTELAVEANLPPGGDEQIVDRLRRIFPDAPETPIRYVAHVPADSDLQGWVSGADVYFLKTYRGTHYGGYQVGDNLVGFENAAHAVEYHGRVSTDGEKIEGRWFIGPTPGQSTERTEGTFELTRDRTG